MECSKWAFFLYYSNYAVVFLGWLPPALGAVWSLAVEEHFYLFWPAFIRFTPRNRLLFWSAVIGVLSLLSRAAITFFHWSWLASYFLTTSRVDSLLTGAILAILVRQQPDWLKRWIIPISAWAFVALAAIIAWRRQAVYSDLPMRTVGYSLLALMFAGLVWIAGNTEGHVSKLIANPVLVAFGKYSYCLYLLHMLVLTLCQRWVAPLLFPRLGWSVDAPLPLFTLTMATAFLLARLSWRFYEAPFLALKDRFSA